jgi:hypothetical protein
VVFRWSGLGWVALGACSLALDCRDEVVIMTMLVVLLLLFEARGRPLVVVYDLFPLALMGVEGRRDRLLAVRVVGRDVEEFPSGSGGTVT